mgnify:FL=1
MSHRLRIDLAYDGSTFYGWALQPGRPTIQGALEDALAKVFRMEPGTLRTVVAGRTDSGVHATGQVCHVDVPESVTSSQPARILKRLRGALGKGSGIWVAAVSRAPEGFDARFSPLARRYEYRIADSVAARDPRRVGYTLWIDDELDVDAMNQVGEQLLGVHDWASFCRARPGATTIRDLQRFVWHRGSDGGLVATVIADAFCHSMVRSLVGAAVAVGRGSLTVDQVISLRDAKTRTSAWKTLAAHGLTLCEVMYPHEDALAARAAQTRAIRGAPLD